MAIENGVPREAARPGEREEDGFPARYRAARGLEAAGRPLEELLAAYEECHRQHPDRAEPLVRAAVLAREAGRFDTAYALARRAARVPRPGPDAPLVEEPVSSYRARDEQSIAAYYLGRHEESFTLADELLRTRPLPDGDRARIERNRDFAVPHVKDAFLRYDAELVGRLAARPAPEEPRVTLTITSCKRLGLFAGTVTSFLNACTDVGLVDRFLCVDDGSPEAEREEMRRLFPFFEFLFKGPSEKGHARSLNLIREAVTTPWLVHLEDDWHFFSRRPYVTAAIEVLEEEPGLGQLLFNRNYAETLEHRDLVGGFRRRSAGGHGYVVHEYHPAGSEALRRFHRVRPGLTCAYWPHFSLRPSVLRTSVLRELGPFDEKAAHFEHEYALRYTRAGLRSAFLDGVHALHTGPLTTERGKERRANAYDLNDEPQFGQKRGPPPA